MKIKSNISYLFAAIAIIIWSTVATAFKIALRYYSVAEVLLISTITSVTTLLILKAVLNKPTIEIQLKRKHLARSLCYGFLNPFLYYLLMFEAYEKLPAQIVQPVIFIWPVILTILVSISHKEKISFSGYLSFVISLAGVFVLISQGSLGSLNLNVNGILLAFLCPIIWAAYWFVNLNDDRKPLDKLSANFIMSLIFIIPTYFLSRENELRLFRKEILAPVYIGLFEMGITFYIWYLAMEKTKSKAKVANLIFLIPVLSFFFIQLVLKEKILMSSIIGLILILLGIFVQITRKRN